MIVTFERRPDPVGGAVGLEPFRRRDLVRAEHGADLVVEDLGRRARQRAQPRLVEPREVGLERLAEAARPLGHLERGEPVDVDARRRGAHRPDHLAGSNRRRSRGGSRPAGRPRSRPARSAVGDALGDLVEAQQVRLAPQVERQRPLAERAEAALERADVGVVDVPVRDVGDGVADRPAAQRRRRTRRSPRTSAPRAEKSAVISATPGSSPSSIPASTSATGPAGSPARDAPGPVRHDDRRARASSTPAHQALSRARPSASACSSTAARIAGASQRSGSAHVLRVDGEARRERRNPRPRGHRRERGRAPARPVPGSRGRSSPARSPRGRRRRPRRAATGSSTRFGGDCTWTSSGRTIRAAATVQRSSSGGHGGAACMRGAGLGEEALDEHLLDVAVPAVRVGDRPQRRQVGRVAVSPMPTRTPS